MERSVTPDIYSTMDSLFSTMQVTVRSVSDLIFHLLSCYLTAGR
jgi:hypothetical protein